MLNWEEYDEDAKAAEIWGSYPSYAAPQMTHAAHPITTKIPPFYDGNTSLLKYSNAVEEWCDLTKVEPKTRGQHCCPVYWVELSSSRRDLTATA